MKDDTNTATRRNYLKAVGAIGAAGAVGLAGCSEEASAATGTLATRVKDAPGDISDFESCVITIEGIWLKASDVGSSDGDEADDENSTDGDNETDGEVSEQSEEDVDRSDGREYHEFDDPQEADLVELQNGNTDLVDEQEIAAQSYEFLQLDVSDVTGTLADGSEPEVGTPGNAPLQFKEPFEIRADQTTTFVADFTPVKRGQTNRYLLQPVASGTQVIYEDEATATGTATQS